MRPVPPSFADLAADGEQLLTTGMVTKGRHLLLFERVVAEHLGVRHAVAVSRCTTIDADPQWFGLPGEVTTIDLPAIVTAVGVPAKTIKTREDGWHDR